MYLKVNSRSKRKVMYETNLTKTELILYAILNEFLIYSSVKKKKGPSIVVCIQWRTRQFNVTADKNDRNRCKRKLRKRLLTLDLYYASRNC